MPAFFYLLVIMYKEQLSHHSALKVGKDLSAKICAICGKFCPQKTQNTADKGFQQE